MKIILDEGVPRQLVAVLLEHAVDTVSGRGWAGIKNGKLLALLEEDAYQAFLTCDKNIPLQQGHLERRCFAVLVLSTNHFPTMQPYLDVIRRALTHTRAGRVQDVHCGTFIPKRFRKQK